MNKREREKKEHFGVTLVKIGNSEKGNLGGMVI